MVDGIHRGHDREKNLRGANITRGLVAADVLLAGLQCQPVDRTSFYIVGNSDKPSGHVPLVFIARGKVGCVRTAESKRNAETLGAADDDIDIKFPGWPQEGEGENVRGDDNERSRGMRLLDKIRVIMDRAVCCRVLQQRSESRASVWLAVFRSEAGGLRH